MLCTRGAAGLTQTHSRRRCVAVKCSVGSMETSTRRALLLAGLSAAAVAAPKASATDFKEALKRKEERKARLKEAAGQIKSSGKDQQVFKKSAYSMPEDSHTPNVHTRQNEGARTQENV